MPEHKFTYPRVVPAPPKAPPPDPVGGDPSKPRHEHEHATAARARHPPRDGGPPRAG